MAHLRSSRKGAGSGLAEIERKRTVDLASASSGQFSASKDTETNLDARSIIRPTWIAVTDPVPVYYRVGMS